MGKPDFQHMSNMQLIRLANDLVEGQRRRLIIEEALAEKIMATQMEAEKLAQLLVGAIQAADPERLWLELDAGRLATNANANLGVEIDPPTGDRPTWLLRVQARGAEPGKESPAVQAASRDLMDGKPTGEA